MIVSLIKIHTQNMDTSAVDATTNIAATLDAITATSMAACHNVSEIDTIHYKIRVTISCALH